MTVSEVKFVTAYEVINTCNTASLPGKKDQVGFVVTRINDRFEVAEGIITRQIKHGA